MIIKINGKLTVIAGQETFISAFRSKNLRIRNRAHKKLFQELEERGYCGNGEPRRKLADLQAQMPAFDPENFDLENPGASWDKSYKMIELFTTSISSFKDRKPLEFWENPDTGQRFSIETLMAATNLWPLDEVMELVPS